MPFVYKVEKNSLSRCIFIKFFFSTPDDASARKCERIFGKTSLLFRIQCAIIEAEMRKHRVFTGISAPYSNIAQAML